MVINRCSEKDVHRRLMLANSWGVSQHLCCVGLMPSMHAFIEHAAHVQRGALDGFMASACSLHEPGEPGRTGSVVVQNRRAVEL